VVAAASPGRPLWRDRNFSIFWAAQTLSVAGDSFAYIAIPLLVLHATGSVAQMGLLTGVAGAASVGAGVFAGVLADLLDRRTLLICCDLARMVLYGTIPLAWSLRAASRRSPPWPPPTSAAAASAGSARCRCASR